MSTLETAFSQLPAPIQDKLGSMIRRVRRLLFIRGLCATLAVALACLLTIMLIDASVTLFSSTSRWVLSLSGLGLTLVATWWFLLRPLSRRFTLTQMARIIEIRHPELQERISTAVELLSSNDPESIKGSEELIGAVVDSAIVDVEAVDPKTEFKPARTAKFASIALALTLIISGALIIWPAQSWTLLQRAVAPFLDIGNAYADSLIVEPGDIRIAKGETVTISVSAKNKKLKRAEIRRLLEDGSESLERMTLDFEGDDGTKQFSISFPAVEEDFTYRLRAGLALTRYYEVTTVVAPAIGQIEVEYDYPDYTNLETKTAVTETGEIRAVANTRVTLTTTPTKEIEMARLVLNNGADLGEPKLVEGSLQWQFDLKPGMNGHWKIELTDADGFTNQPPTYPLEVLPDKSPSVIVTQPVERELRLRPTEQLPVISEIIEDFGFKDAAFVIIPIGTDRPEEIPIELPTATRIAETYVSNATLNLSKIKVNGNQRRLGVQVMVRDSRPESYDGPGEGLSELFFITLDVNAKTLAQQAVEAKKKAVEEQLRKAKQDLEKARDEMRRAEQELKRTDDVSERAMRPLKQFSENAENARMELDKVAASLDESFLQEQADKAKAIANEEVAKARETSDLIPMTDNKSERIEKSQEAREQIEEAITGIDEIAKAMREANEKFDMISKLNDLANRQQELANRAEEMSREKAQREAAIDQATREFTQQKLEELANQQMNQFRNQQEQVQEQLGEMLQDNPEALEEVLGAQLERAQQLAAAADALAENQKDLKALNVEATHSNAAKQEALRGQLIDHLQKEQEKIASQMHDQSEAAANNPQSPKATASDTNTTLSDQGENETSKKLAKASDQARETAAQLANDNLESAAKSANAASESMAEAAASDAAATPEASSSDPSSSEASPGEPEMAEASDQPATTESNQPEVPDTPLPSLGDLAQRQDAIAEQIEMVRDGDLQQTLSAIEAQLQADAQTLRAETNSFEETLQSLDQHNARSAADRAEQALIQGANEAKDAAQHLANAEQMQDQAQSSGQLSSGELSQPAQQAMQRAAQEQQQAAEALDRASGALEASASSLAQSQEQIQPFDDGNQVADSGEMAGGFNDVTESAQSEDAQQASQQAQEAADSLQQLAQNAMKKLGAQGQNQSMADSDQPNSDPDLASEPDGSLNLNESGEKSADAYGSNIPPELKAMGVSAEDWSRFKGAISGGNAAGIETDLPAEYRELVGRYFQVIAKEAGKE